MSRLFSRPRRVKHPLRRRGRLSVEQLEERCLLAYTPAQMVHAYGFDLVSFTGGVAGNGNGQTIAIVDAFDDPTIASDLTTFNAQYGLPNTGFTKATPQGQPVVDTGWAEEIALDVEWAHAIAPQANILLVEALDNSYANMLAAVDYAASQPGVTVVSMSWGSSEFAAQTTSDYDGHFTGHPGVTFVGASGDGGKPGIWPAFSTNVVSVGGTKLNLNASGTWLSETGWGNGNLSFLFGGSGGGISQFEPKPSYQSGVKQSTNHRTSPDVAYNADPNTGVSVYDSNNGGWLQIGGTSAGAPQFAALIAIVNQGRAINGAAPLSTSDVLTRLYQVAQADFHDITKGNNGYAAAKGYDLVTGRGSPIANKLIPDLVSTVLTSPTTAAVSTPSKAGLTGRAARQLVVFTNTPTVPLTTLTTTPFGSADTARNFQAAFTQSASFQAPLVQTTAFGRATQAARTGSFTSTFNPSSFGTNLSGASDDSDSKSTSVEELRVLPAQSNDETQAVTPAGPSASDSVKPTGPLSRIAVDAFFMANSISDEQMDRLPTAPIIGDEPTVVEPSAAMIGLVALFGGFWTIRQSQEEQKRRWVQR